MKTRQHNYGATDRYAKKLSVDLGVSVDLLDENQSINSSKLHTNCHHESHCSRRLFKLMGFRGVFVKMAGYLRHAGRVLSERS
jgi:hypothetical protein